MTNEELVQIISKLEKRLDNLIMPEVIGPLRLAIANMMSMYQTLPGLVGLWPMASTAISSGNAPDLSGNGKTLTHNGNPRYARAGASYLVPCIYCDGAGDYLSRASEADLNIIGTEGVIATAWRGLTIGGWFYVASGASPGYLIGKANNTNGPYFLYATPGTNVLFRVRDSTDTTNYSVAEATVDFRDGWHFIVGRYDPSTEVKIWVDDTTNVNTTSIPASLQSGPDNFGIMGNGVGTGLLIGYTSFCFLTATILSDDMIDDLYENTRDLFGV
jgi:hypothetical protein